MASRLNRCGPQAKLGSRARELFFFRGGTCPKILQIFRRTRQIQFSGVRQANFLRERERSPRLERRPALVRPCLALQNDFWVRKGLRVKSTL